ncbi:MAG: PIG-L family deacetylase [Anaerolineales bacterium]|nr:PIG-L family deacetylase [Anaerolineales bacterium]
MKLVNQNAEVFVPNNSELEEALGRTTHLAIGAHHDDLEIMAIDGILQCFQQPDKWFSGVVVTNGSGSPRTGLYADYTDEQMMDIRIVEQKKAALLGDYAAQIFLSYPSSAVKDGDNRETIADLVQILQATKPQVVYTHNLADKHLTHIGVVVKVIQAIRELPPGDRPQKLYGCEVWRGLDWIMDDEKVVFDCSGQTNLQAALLGVFDSQLSGGKRYDLATMGRRLANATFYASHDTDKATGLAYAMDLSTLIKDDNLEITDFVQDFIHRFAQDVERMIVSVI